MREEAFNKFETDLKIVTAKNSGLAKLRTLALKNRYLSYINDGDYISILISLYEKRRNIAGMKTSEAVVKYHKLIADELDKIFEAKENRVYMIILDLIRKKNIRSIDFHALLSETDLKKISLMAGHELSVILTERFGIVSTIPIIKIELTGFDLNSELVQLLLERLGVSPDLEKEEMFESLVRRVYGIVNNMKLKIIRDLQKKAAGIIYSIHDELIDNRLEEKIMLLEEKLLDFELYHTEKA